MGLAAHPGSSVGLLMGNRLEFVEVDFAIAKAGMVKAPINPRLTDDERAFILANCGAEVVVTEGTNFERSRPSRPRLSGLRHVVNVGRPRGFLRPSPRQGERRAAQVS